MDDEVKDLYNTVRQLVEIQRDIAEEAAKTSDTATLSRLLYDTARNIELVIGEPID